MKIDRTLGVFCSPGVRRDERVACWFLVEYSCLNLQRTESWFLSHHPSHPTRVVLTCYSFPLIFPHRKVVSYYDEHVHHLSHLVIGRAAVLARVSQLVSWMCEVGE